ncbi:Helitron helicase [Phytophthora megakarya]|uniref:Helitron helicase n=1 Tax=Phytophthora megakarya TaxID=4795 RepID=A0A225UPQ8_9STRA|nr:Helitron helicase [Phytophthora megakarya]
MSELEEKDAAENIHREDDVRARMAEYKALKYLAHYLASNSKTLEVYSLPDVRAYSDVFAEVDGPATVSIVQQELNTYSQTDLEHVTELIGQVNSNQPDVFDQVVRAVEHPVGGEKLYLLDGPGGTGKSFLLVQILAACSILAQKCYVRMFDLSAKVPLQQHCYQGAYRTFDVSLPGKVKGGTDLKQQLNFLG